MFIFVEKSEEHYNLHANVTECTESIMQRDAFCINVTY